MAFLDNKPNLLRFLMQETAIVTFIIETYSGIINEEYLISHNEIEENTALYLNDGNDIIVANHVLLTIDEHDRLYNFYNYDVNYDDDTNVGMHKDDIALDNDIELDHDWMRDDDEVNDAFEVPIRANCDVHFVSVGFRMDSVLISPTGDDSHRHHNDIELDHDWMRGDDEVNDAFEVPIKANCDVHFASAEFRMNSIPILYIGDDSHRHHPIRNESNL
ncbi:hypothetical protein FNV43_RR08455 [Rhamnella rubrinervis]|uniref:Uncharacterized protein n=1 Tax=Rhamnella rubrinervis TaxID=2594499 RepID=A0A8K0H892_9ROSA|nr:hypothetical protein FNV43_RR08455 [Rhamnella rubrinervis]